MIRSGNATADEPWYAQQRRLPFCSLAMTAPLSNSRLLVDLPGILAYDISCARSVASKSGQGRQDAIASVLISATREVTDGAPETTR